MSACVLFVDPDFGANSLLDEQLAASGCTSHRARSASEAASFILARGKNLIGLVTVVDFPGAQSGWDLARIARRSNSEIAIGYRSVRQAGDWSAFGVPNSTVLDTPLAEAALLGTFVQACQRARNDWNSGSDAGPGSVGGLKPKTDPPQPAGSIESLRQERDALQTLFEMAPSFIAILDGPDHRFIFANKSYLTLVDRHVVVGRTVLEAFPEVAAQGFIALLDGVYRTGKAYRAHGVPLSFDSRGGIGRTTFVDFIYHPVRGAAGEVTGIFVQGIDVTERVAAQEHIKTLQNELLHVGRLNALGTLVSALAHELNQPLTVIANYMAMAAILAEDEAPSVALAQCLEGTRDAAMRAGHVIRRLRDMATRRDFSRQPITLEMAIRETIAIAGAGRPDCVIELRHVTDASVLADRIQIQQVLLNLLQNALEIDGDGPCHILVSATDFGCHAEVAVCDSGPGIAPDLLPTIFDPFVTTKIEGMGVGLSICRTIVEAHGGTLSARNLPGRGARLSFTLPKAAAA